MNVVGESRRWREAFFFLKKRESIERRKKVVRKRRLSCEQELLKKNLFELRTRTLIILFNYLLPNHHQCY